MSTKEKPKQENVFDEALRLLEGPKREAYGDLSESFWRIAGLWTGYLGTEVSASNVAMMMTLFKLSREQHCHHRDNIVDAMAYLYAYNELRNA